MSLELYPLKTNYMKKSVILSVCVLLFTVAQGQKVVPYDSIKPMEPYNFILGTNTIGGQYQFTNESRLLEQAKHVRGMGSNILKISLGPNSAGLSGWIPPSIQCTVTSPLVFSVFGKVKVTWLEGGQLSGKYPL